MTKTKYGSYNYQAKTTYTYAQKHAGTTKKNKKPKTGPKIRKNHLKQNKNYLIAYEGG